MLVRASSQVAEDFISDASGNRQREALRNIEAMQTLSLKCPTRYGSFFREVWRKGQPAGALVPSSRYLADLMVHNTRAAAAERIIELGAGDGTVTAEIFRQKRPTARILAVERNLAFASALSTRFAS